MGKLVKIMSVSDPMMNSFMSFLTFVSLLFVQLAVSSGTSLALSSVLSVLVFSGMQMNKQWLVSSQPLTLLAGFLASLLFVLVLTVSSLYFCNIW